MSIRKWRYVRDSDDGCNIYQCLSCYNSYDGRDNPSDWKFCPYCGVEWIGEHKWLIYDDDWNIITPARRRKDRYVSKIEPTWHIELQEMPLFRCDDGAYVALQDGSVKSRWSSIYHVEDMLGKTYNSKEMKDWRSLCESLITKYGRRYGLYIYYKRFMSNFLKNINKNTDIMFSCGCDYRLRFAFEKHYHDVLQERFIDMGGWRKNQDETYSVRNAGETFKADDLEHSWKNHVHE